MKFSELKIGEVFSTKVALFRKINDDTAVVIQSKLLMKKSCKKFSPDYNTISLTGMPPDANQSDLGETSE